MKDFKAAFTPEAIRRIHEAVDLVWRIPSSYEELFAEERESSSGLYVGMYEPRSSRGASHGIASTPNEFF